MKLSILTLAAPLLVSTFALSQQLISMEDRISDLKLKLELTDQQVTDVRLILTSAREQEKEQWKLNKGDERAMQAAAKERNELTDRQIENILSAEQKKKYEEIRQKEPHYSDPQLMELCNRLNLTDEQAVKVEAILENARAKRENLEKSSGDRREKFETMRKIREDTDKEIEALLTSEQKAGFKKYQAERESKMKEMRGQRPGRRRMR